MESKDRLAGGTTARLSYYYVLALTLIAVLSFAGHLLMRISLNRQLDDAHLINTVGRQRMLSQRLIKEMLLARGSIDVQQRKQSASHLQHDLRQWTVQHRALRDGNAADRMAGQNDRLSNLLDEIEPHYQVISAATANTIDLLRSQDDEISGRLAEEVLRVLQHEGTYLAGMERVVLAYDREAESRVRASRSTASVLLLVTLSVLLMEGLLIFRPAVRQIRRGIDQLQRTGRELALARDSAEQANHAKSRFLATVSHELRTPLNAILGLTDQVLREPLEEDQRRRLRTVHGASTHLMKLITDLLDASHLESVPKIELKQEEFDLCRLIAECVSLVRDQAEAKGLDLRLMTRCPWPGRLRGDTSRLRQVLLNLIDNAIKYTSSGTVTVALESAPPTDDSLQSIEMSVSDTGLGIPPHALKSVFGCFQQLDPERRPGGVGLGLFISAKIAEAMEGVISVTSRVNQGSKFTVHLKLDKAANTEGGDAAMWELRTPPVRGDAPHGVHVLVGDDTETNQILLADYLDSFRCTYDIVGNGQQAVEQAARCRYDAIILDLRMPGTDGFEAARQIRASEREQKLERCPIIAITANADPQKQRSALEAGMDVCLQKPVSAESLWQSLASYVHPVHAEDGDSSTAPLSINNELRQQLATAAIGILPLSLQLLHEAASRRDGIQAGLIAHRIAGSAGYFGASRLCARCRRLEQSSASAEASVWVREVPAIVASAHQLLASLEKLTDAKPITT